MGYIANHSTVYRMSGLRYHVDIRPESGHNKGRISDTSPVVTIMCTVQFSRILNIIQHALRRKVVNSHERNRSDLYNSQN